MASVFCCGGECGQAGSVGQHWSGTLTFSTTTVRSGARSIAVAGGNTAATNVTVTDSGVVRFYFNLSALPTTNVLFYLTSSLVVRVDSAGAVTLWDSGSNSSASAGTVAANEWNRIDFSFDGASLFGKVRLNGGTEQTLDLPSAVSGSFAFNINATNLGASKTVYVDDLIMSGTLADYPLGAGYVNHFVPTADGTHNIAGANDYERGNTGTDITNATTDAYLLVDDVPLDDTTPDTDDFIQMVTPTANSYVEVILGPASGISTPTTGPRAVEVIAGVHDDSTGANNWEILLNDNGSFGTVHNANQEAGTTTIRYKRAHFADPPSAATAWHAANDGTDGDFRDLRVRFGATGTVDANPDHHFDCVMVEAEFADSATSSTGAGTFPAFTGSAVGAMLPSSTGAGTFTAFTGSAVGTQTQTSTAAGTFTAFVGAAVGTQTQTSTAAGTFPVFVGAATGTQTQTSTAAGAFTALTGAAVGVMLPSGTGAGTFTAFVGAATGTQTQTSTAAGDFPALTGAAVAAMLPSGTGAGTFSAFVGAAAGTQTQTSTAAGTFAALAGAATGTQTQSSTGAGTFASLAGSAVGTQTQTSTGAGTFPALTGEASGNQAGDAPTSTAAGVFASFTGAAIGTQTQTSTAAGTFASLTGAATGTQTLTSTAAGTFPVFVGAAVGTQTQSSTAAGTFSAFVGDAAGTQTQTATAAGTFPVLNGAAVATELPSATSAGTFPAFVGAAEGTVTALSAPSGSATPRLVRMDLAAGPAVDLFAQALPLEVDVGSLTVAWLLYETHAWLTYRDTPAAVDIEMALLAQVASFAFTVIPRAVLTELEATAARGTLAAHEADQAEPVFAVVADELTELLMLGVL